MLLCFAPPLPPPPGPPAKPEPPRTSGTAAIVLVVLVVLCAVLAPIGWATHPPGKPAGQQPADSQTVRSPQ